MLFFLKFMCCGAISAPLPPGMISEILAPDLVAKLKPKLEPSGGECYAGR